VTGAQVHGHTGPDWRRDPSERELGGGSRCVGSCGALRLPHCNTHTLCSQHHALPHATVHATHLALLHVQIWRRNWRWGGRRRSGFWEGRKKEGGSCEIRSSRASGIMSVDMLYTHTVCVLARETRLSTRTHARPPPPPLRPTTPDFLPPPHLVRRRAIDILRQSDSPTHISRRRRATHSG
jgi:hypothetical protein